MGPGKTGAPAQSLCSERTSTSTGGNACLSFACRGDGCLSGASNFDRPEACLTVARMLREAC